MNNTNKRYITTPIYYVTAAPHLGSLYSTLLADVLARWARLEGKKTFFLTGTDEHGQKVAQAAEKAGKEPQAFVDSFIPAYKDTWHLYNISYDDFIRTTDKKHVHAVQNWIRELQKKGDIYKSLYQGWYCTPDEAFVNEKDVADPALLDPRGSGPACPTCGRQTHYISEETYFFRLSKYQDALLKLYEENPDFVIPRERINEVINFVKSGLKDLSISRTSVRWGIPFPDDPAHVAYVWIDALNNYITAIGYPSDMQQFNQWWPADVQVLGKDILRFHAVYWPALLMATGLPVPTTLLVHGWIQINNQKMSKSLQNVVDPVQLYHAYGIDQVRYYLMRMMAINHDGEFSIADLEQRINADLANDLGNLLNRMVLLAEKTDAFTLVCPTGWSPSARALRDECATMIKEVSEYMHEYQCHMALSRAWKFINQANAYFHAHEPWKLVKSDRAAFEQVLSATAHSLRAIGVILTPFMPTKMDLLLQSLGKPYNQEKNAHVLEELSVWDQDFQLHKIANLFEKVERKETPVIAELTKSETNYIAIDDLTKVELVVGTIEQCEVVEKSDKLLKMQINFGERGMRQILAGIRHSYQPADLIGKQGIFVFNLKPRAMMGMESQGMMLVAETTDGKVTMATVASSVPNGARLR